MPDPKRCAVRGCVRAYHAKGLCRTHYEAARRKRYVLHGPAPATITHIPPHRPRCTSCGQPDRVYEWTPPVGDHAWWYCAACQWQWEAR